MNVENATMDESTGVKFKAVLQELKKGKGPVQFDLRKHQQHGAKHIEEYAHNQKREESGRRLQGDHKGRASGDIDFQKTAENDEDNDDEWREGTLVKDDVEVFETSFDGSTAAMENDSGDADDNDVDKDVSDMEDGENWSPESQHENVMDKELANKSEIITEAKDHSQNDITTVVDTKHAVDGNATVATAEGRIGVPLFN